MKSRLVLLGAPATGKGTQAALLSAAFRIPSASTGAMLREEARRGTALGMEAARYTTQGGMFPDEMAMAVVWAWLRGKTRFLLDGFPRSLPQARQFDSGLAERHQSLDAVFLLELPERVIRERLSGRLTCEHCGGVYNGEFHGVSTQTPCPTCGGVLGRRNDDTEEALELRMREYREKTLPVVEHYRNSGLLIAVDATPGRDAIFKILHEEIRR